MTYEATVENGRVKLPDIVHLPEHAKIFVVVPGRDEPPTLHLRSPRLAQPGQAVDFLKEVTEEPRDAGV